MTEPKLIPEWWGPRTLTTHVEKMEVEVTQEELGGKTNMTLEHCGLPEGEMLKMTKQVWNESFDKLEECLN
jgi:uncharacterized protein YndB with AHSA1/START domain